MVPTLNSPLFKTFCNTESEMKINKGENNSFCTKLFYKRISAFENELVVVELADTNFYRVLDYLKISGGHPISNIKLAVNKDRITHNLDLNKTVRILTSDYLANGGDKMAFFKDSVSHTKTGLKIRDILLIECIKIDTLHTTIDNRFTYD